MGTLRNAEHQLLREPLLKAFALLSLVAAVGAWWMVLGRESRRMAEDESNRHNELLVREINAHRRTDTALQAAKDLAEAANQAKTRYVTGMTHELRTPLNGILGYAQILLKDDQIRGAQRAAVDTIHHSGEHLHGLIDGLLDLARIEAGKLRLDIAPLPMRDFLDDVVRMVAPQAANKGLAFELRTIGRVPTYVRADARRLRQILINLLGNAVRFTDSGSVTLRVDHSRAVARFDIIDSGIGIAPQDLERIFLPFERGSGGRRTGEPGTGLGLTITHLLTQLMGGELTVRSTPGEGSTFTARLYLSETAEPSRMRVASHRPVTGYIGKRRTLLIVDDHTTQRQMLAGMLLPLGFRIREAGSGRECLESVLAVAAGRSVARHLDGRHGRLGNRPQHSFARRPRHADHHGLGQRVRESGGQARCGRLPGLCGQTGDRVRIACHAAASPRTRMGGRTGGSELGASRGGARGRCRTAAGPPGTGPAAAGATRTRPGPAARARCACHRARRMPARNRRPARAGRPFRLG